MIKLAINWDGTVPLCCADVNGTDYGNTNTETLHDIWHSKHMNIMRGYVCKDTCHANFEVCEDCCFVTDRFNIYKGEKP